MRKSDRIAVLFSDLHLSLLRPACRADDDWMATQAGYLRQLKEFAGDLPIIFAGDLFDRWNVQPELINFALEHLPDGMISIPGQHDLPNHRLDEMHRSGYGVLVEAKKIRDISGKYTGNMGGFICHGFAWGQPIAPPQGIPIGIIHLAVVHQYCWTTEKCYPGAPEESHFSAFNKRLEGYDAALFGDNHIGFQATAGDCNIINTGGFIRRKSDEKDYRPRIGVLYDDGVIKTKFLDVSADKFFDDVTDREEVPINMRDFIKGLEELGEHGLNFREAVENHIRSEDINSRTKEIILKALDAE